METLIENRHRILFNKYKCSCPYNDFSYFNYESPSSTLVHNQFNMQNVNDRLIDFSSNEDFYQRFIKTIANERNFYPVLDITKYNRNSMLLPSLPNTSYESSSPKAHNFEHQDRWGGNEKNDSISNHLNVEIFSLPGSEADSSNLSNTLQAQQQTNIGDISVSVCHSKKFCHEESGNIQLTQTQNIENCQQMLQNSIPNKACSSIYSNRDDSIQVQKGKIFDVTYSILPNCENMNTVLNGIKTSNKYAIPFRRSRTPFLLKNIIPNDVAPVKFLRNSKSRDGAFLSKIVSSELQLKASVTSEIKIPISQSLNTSKKRKNIQPMPYSSKKTLKNKCQTETGNNSSDIFDCKISLNPKIEKTHFRNYRTIHKCISKSPKKEIYLHSSGSSPTEEVLTEESLLCFESKDVKMVLNQKSRHQHPNLLEICELPKIMSPHNSIDDGVHAYNRSAFDSELSVTFDYDAVRSTNCSLLSCKTKEASLQMAPYQNKIILYTSAVHSLSFKPSVISNKQDQFSKYSKFTEVKTNKDFEWKEEELNVDADKCVIPSKSLEQERKCDDITSEPEDELCVYDELLDSEDDSLLNNFDEDSNSSESMFEDDNLNNVSEVLLGGEEIFSNSNIPMEKLLTAEILSKTVHISENVAECVEPKKSNTGDLLSDLPIILKYVNDDTLEVEEMLIYAKEHLDSILKTCETEELTRPTIIEKLISVSRVYDGKIKLGIIMNIRQTRKSLQNKNTILAAEDSSLHSSIERAKASKEAAAEDSRAQQEYDVCITPDPIPDSSPLLNFSRTTEDDLQQPQGNTSPPKLNLSRTLSISPPHSRKLESTFPSNSHLVKHQYGIGANCRSRIPESLSRPYRDLNRENRSGNEKLKGGSPKIRQSIVVQKSDKQQQTEEHHVNRVDITPFSLHCVNRQASSTEYPKRIYSSTPFSTLKEKYNSSNTDQDCKQSTVFFHTARKHDISVEVKSLNYHLKKVSETKQIAEFNSTRHHKYVSRSTPLTLKKFEFSRAESAVSPVEKTEKVPIKRRMSAEEIISSDFKVYFRFYAKFGGRLKSGSVISKANSNYWLKKTLVIFDDRSAKIAEECFDEIARKKLVLNIYDYIQYLMAISRRKRTCLFDLVQQLKSVDISVPLQNKKTTSTDVLACENHSPDYHHAIAVRNPHIKEKTMPCTLNRRSSRIPISSTSIKNLQVKS